MSAPDFYDCDEDTDTLKHETSHEAVMYLLDGTHTSAWPDTLTVYAWERQSLSDKERGWMASRVAEHFYDSVFEEYRDPNKPAPAELAQLARNFVDSVIEDIGIWSCDRAKEHDEIVVVANWIRENEPSWIADDADIAAWCEARLAC